MRTERLLIAGLACFALGGFASVAVADTECAQWQTGALWSFRQDNGFIVHVDFDPDQAHGLRGKATCFDGDHYIYGLAEGNVSATKLAFTIHWDNGTGGNYEATISPQGRVEGFTYDLNNRRSTAGFSGGELMHCAKWVESAPAGESPQTSSGPQAKPDAIMNQARPFCETYAIEAVSAARESQDLKCGNRGPRWSTDKSGHLNWCLALGGDRTLPNSETAARTAGLNACRQTAQQGQSDHKVKIPIGAVTKPVTPSVKIEGAQKLPGRNPDLFKRNQ